MYCSQSSPIDLDEVFEFLLMRVEDSGVLTTGDLAAANELTRQIKAAAKTPPKRGWFSWLVA